MISRGVAAGGEVRCPQIDKGSIQMYVSLREPVEQTQIRLARTIDSGCAMREGEMSENRQLELLEDKPHILPSTSEAVTDGRCRTQKYLPAKSVHIPMHVRAAGFRERRQNGKSNIRALRDVVFIRNLNMGVGDEDKESNVPTDLKGKKYLQRHSIKIGGDSWRDGRLPLSGRQMGLQW
ncbi:hypothetical protein B0H13DRAFT_2277904 [Mycena leptocephala]|nr:hypothetical protein B0H13DRAFT_2277904 [Mycena leptocephala]